MTYRGCTEGANRSKGVSRLGRRLIVGPFRCTVTVPWSPAHPAEENALQIVNGRWALAISGHEDVSTSLEGDVQKTPDLCSGAQPGSRGRATPINALHQHDARWPSQLPASGCGQLLETEGQQAAVRHTDHFTGLSARQQTPGHIDGDGKADSRTGEIICVLIPIT